MGVVEKGKPGFMTKRFVEECSKVGYISKKEAMTVRNAIMNGHRRNRPDKLRAYPCPVCGNGIWHLTKK